MPSSTAASKPPSTSISPSSRPSALPNELLHIAESQWLFKEEDLLLAPSILAGLSPNQDRENRAKGVNFILQVGIMLKLPQITLASASVFLHRFFMRHPMIEDKVNRRPAHHYYSVAATCLFLATKVEENCRKMKELVVACVRVAQKNPNKIVDEQDKEFWRWRDTILQLEDLLLDALCFDLSLEPPYKILFAFLVRFGEENNKTLRNAAWAFLNDSCLTPLCLLWPSRTIAAAALYAAARHCNVNFLDGKHGKPWWEDLGVGLQDLKKACNFMAGVYENAPLRGGAEESIYQRTPDEGDEASAKTRKRRAEGRTEAETQFTERRDSAASASASDVSRKRGRYEDEGEIRESSETEHHKDDDVPGSGEYSESQDAKRFKVDEGTNRTSFTNRTNGAKGTNERPVSSGGSEEGELEE